MTAEQLRRPAVRTPVRRAVRSRTTTRVAPDMRDQQQTQDTPAIGTGTDTPPLPEAPAEQPETGEISDTEIEVGQQVPTTPEALNKAAGSSDTASHSTASTSTVPQTSTCHMHHEHASRHTKQVQNIMETG